MFMHKGWLHLTSSEMVKLMKPRITREAFNKRVRNGYPEPTLVIPYGDRNRYYFSEPVAKEWLTRNTIFTEEEIQDKLNELKEKVKE